MTVSERRPRLLSIERLETVFQPLVELDTNEPVAYEALTRFPRETRSTSECFTDATALGFGLELELAAIRSALTHLGEIAPPTRLSINVSPAVATNDEFFALVAPVADRLMIELTEHEPVSDYEALCDTLWSLRTLGALIAIDDVGAGFATLRHILRLRPDILKLDLSLTHAVETDPGARALTAALKGFADDTGSLIAAEGIETEGELDLLRKLGIDHGQGYFIGRPQRLLAQVQ